MVETHEDVLDGKKDYETESVQMDDASSRAVAGKQLASTPQQHRAKNQHQNANLNAPPGVTFKKSYGQGLEKFDSAFGGVCDDYKRRSVFCCTDITDGYTRKTLSAAALLYLATFCSTVALGSSVARRTDDHIGLNEYLLWNGVAGMIHSVFGCQPLLILRPTGPITLMLAQIYDVARDVNVNFFTLLAWTGIGVGILMTIIAATEFSRHIAMLSHFAHDVFLFFVSSIYVVDGVSGIAEQFSTNSNAEALFAFVLASFLVLATFALGNLKNVEGILCKSFRFLLSDYGLSLAMVATTAVSYAYYGTSVEVDRIKITGIDGHGVTSAQPTLEGRSWGVPVFKGENLGIAAPLGLALSIPITIFFYFDQNLSSLLCQSSRMQLSKGSYYHSSFLWMGIFNFIGPFFGLPFVTGSLPHSPQMVRALTHDDVTRLLTNGGPAVSENRIAPFLVYVMILVSYLLLGWVIELIPTAAADAVLIVVGLQGIFDTSLWSRLATLVTPNSECTNADPRAARKFTLLQIMVILCGWILNVTPAALAFPLVIACLVPIRHFVLPMMFTRHQLDQLESEHLRSEIKKSSRARDFFENEKLEDDGDFKSGIDMESVDRRSLQIPELKVEPLDDNGGAE